MAHVLTQLKLVPRAETSEAVSLARELGLELQARRYEKPLAENAFTPLTSDELWLWATHCPTRYIPGGGQNRSKLEDYSFDNIPVEVMRHWKAVKDHYTFDRYEIWTTERTQNTDPLLMGVIGQAFYLLARWGMESPENLPLKKIAQDIYDDAMRYANDQSPHYPFQSAANRRKSELRFLLKVRPGLAPAMRYLGLKEKT